MKENLKSNSIFWFSKFKWFNTLRTLWFKIFTVRTPDVSFNLISCKTFYGVLWGYPPVLYNRQFYYRIIQWDDTQMVVASLKGFSGRSAELCCCYLIRYWETWETSLPFTPIVLWQGETYICSLINSWECFWHR